MAHLTVKNFGPVKNFDGNIDDFSLIIGKQASGKSTIAQLVYFFKMFPDYLANTPWGEVEHSSSLMASFAKVIRQKFLDYFGPFSSEDDFSIIYDFSPTGSPQKLLRCEIIQKKHLTDANFSKPLVHAISNFIKTVSSEEINGRRGLNYYTGIVQAKEARDPQANYLKATKQIFSSQQTPFYIPAGRVLFPLLSGQQGGVLFSSRQFVLREYNRILTAIRPTFHETLETIEQNVRQFNDAGDLSRQAQFARELITDILGGKFEIVQNDERIYHSDGKNFTSLQYASSGQQETVWIALLAYLLILEAKPVFVVFEEPESHLYPLAQNSLLRLLVLAFLANKNNSVIVTTHSPYILSAANNLISAHNIVSEQPDSVTEEKINAIIDKHLWLPFERVNAYKSGEQFEGILDTEEKMIKTELIDEVSTQLNIEFDQLLENVHD